MPANLRTSARGSHWRPPRPASARQREFVGKTRPGVRLAVLPMAERYYVGSISAADRAELVDRQILLRRARSSRRGEALAALRGLRDRYRLRLPLVEAHWGLGAGWR